MTISKTPQQVTNAPAAQTHKAFSWISEQMECDSSARFAALMIDVANGIGTCLEIVQSTMMAPALAEDPLLSENDTMNLLRLAIVSARMLEEKAESQIEWLTDCHARKAK